MKPFYRLIRSIRMDDSGNAAIEMGIIASLVAMMGIFAMSSVGQEVNQTFGEISRAMDKTAPGAPVAPAPAPMPATPLPSSPVAAAPAMGIAGGPPPTLSASGQ